MPDSGTNSLLAGLVQGFAGARAQQAHVDLATRVQQQQSMLAYFHAMANNPNVPPEHQQWAMEQGLQLAQHDVSKPFPKGLGDLSKLPPVNIQQAPRQTVSQAPAMTLTMPQPPGGGQPQATPQQPPTAPTAPNGNQVGRAPNGTVNAIGQAKQLEMPTPPPNLGAVVPSSVNIPAGAPTAIQNPQPPVQIAPGGAPHVLTPGDRTQYALAAQQQEMNALQRQYPTKSQEELAYFSQHGEFPKPVPFSLTPGEQRFDEKGNLVAENKNLKPGTKSGFEPMMGPAGPIGVKDVATGGMLTPEEVIANPHAKAVWDQAKKEHATQLTEQEEKERRAADRQAAQQARSFDQQIRMLEARQEALSGTTKTMVETAPKVSKLIERVRQDMQDVSEGPVASRWQEFWAGKVGVDNPGFTKLRTDVGLLQTLLMRMHVGARGGGYMMAHFKGLLDSGKQSAENMNAALDEMHAYAGDVTEEGESAKAAVAVKAEGGRSGGHSITMPKRPKGGPSTAPYNPPSGAPRAVGPNGHEIVVDGGRWVDAQTGQPL